MELTMTGYRMSEVGLIPEDWEVRDLSEAATIKRGKFTARPRNDPRFYGGPIPFVQTGDITACKGKIQTYSQTLNEAGLGVSVLFKSGTILMTIAANIGYTGILQIDMACPDSLVAIDGFEEIDNKYLNCYFSFQREEIEKLSTSGAQRNLSIELLRPFRLALPPTKAEQTAIATALSDMDDLIGGLERLIAKKRAIKEGAMQVLLTGRVRLEGFEKMSGYKDSEIGSIPNDWSLLRIIDTVDKRERWSFTGGPFGSNLKSSDYQNEGVRVIQLQNIGDGEFVNDSHIFTSNSKADELLGCNIYPGDIILSKMGDPVARACIIPNFHDRYLMCSDGIRFVPDKRAHDSLFIHAIINAPLFRNSAENASTGSTRKRIGLNILRELLLLCPPLKEQTAIARILSDMDAELAVFGEKLQKYRKIKEGMMQELLTGKIRLI